MSFLGAMDAHLEMRRLTDEGHLVCWGVAVVSTSVEARFNIDASLSIVDTMSNGLPTPTDMQRQIWKAEQDHTCVNQASEEVQGNLEAYLRSVGLEYTSVGSDAEADKEVPHILRY